MAQQPNGAGANNAAALNGSLMPSAGHYADMQTLMQSMEQLSGWLQQNREEFAGVQERLALVERRGLRSIDAEAAAQEEGEEAAQSKSDAHCMNSNLRCAFFLSPFAIPTVSC